MRCGQQRTILVLVQGQAFERELGLRRQGPCRQQQRQREDPARGNHNDYFRSSGLMGD